MYRARCARLRQPLFCPLLQFSSSFLPDPIQPHDGCSTPWCPGNGVRTAGPRRRVLLQLPRSVEIAGQIRRRLSDGRSRQRCSSRTPARTRCGTLQELGVK